MILALEAATSAPATLAIDWLEWAHNMGSRAVVIHSGFLLCASQMLDEVDSFHTQSPTRDECGCQCAVWSHASDQPMTTTFAHCKYADRGCASSPDSAFDKHVDDVWCGIASIAIGRTCLFDYNFFAACSSLTEWCVCCVLCCNSILWRSPHPYSLHLFTVWCRFSATDPVARKHIFC